MDTPSLILENEKRKLKFTAKYDPSTGEGSLLPRHKVKIAEIGTMWLPYCMIVIPEVQVMINAGSFARVLEMGGQPVTEQNIATLKNKFIDIRLDEDFEYWAIKTVKIKPKLSNDLIFFRLRYSQQKLLRNYEVEHRWIKKPLRLNLLKARQWGGSTLTQIYFNWIQVRRLKNCNALIVAAVETQSRVIRAMFTKIAENYPKEYGKIKLTPFEGATTIRQIEGRGGVVGLGSMQNPEASRGADYQYVHASEIGSWKKTLGKEPEDLVQSIRSGIANVPDTGIVQESTAKGTGNYWYDEWIASINGESGYYPFFVGYWEIEMYQEPIEDYEAFITEINSWDPVKRDRSWEHWRDGATLEAIKWYWEKKKQERFDDWRMMAEYPSNWREAFQSTSERVFPTGDVVRMRDTWACDPKFIGECIADADSGTEALENIRFVAGHSGTLKVWRMPVVGTHRNRFVTIVDIGGTGDKADYSTITVIDRLEFLHGGVPEAVATWKSHLPQDMVAWMAARIATAYDSALLVIESNSLKKEKDGDHFLTVLNEIKDYYENIYCRTSLDKIKEGAPVQYGFHTNGQTKPMIVSFMRGLFRKDGCVEYDDKVLVEADQFEKKDNGEYGATQGAHDDLIMGRMIGFWVAYNAMDQVTVIDKNKTTMKRREVVGDGVTNF